MSAIASATSAIRKWQDFVAAVATCSTQKLLDSWAHPCSLAMPHPQSGAGLSTGFHFTSSLLHRAVMHPPLCLIWHQCFSTPTLSHWNSGQKYWVPSSPLVSVHPPLSPIWTGFSKARPVAQPGITRGGTLSRIEDASLFFLKSKLQDYNLRSQNTLGLILTVCLLL